MVEQFSSDHVAQRNAFVAVRPRTAYTPYAQGAKRGNRSLVLDI